MAGCREDVNGGGWQQTKQGPPGRAVGCNSGGWESLAAGGVSGEHAEASTRAWECGTAGTDPHLPPCREYERIWEHSEGANGRGMARNKAGRGLVLDAIGLGFLVRSRVGVE